MASPSPLILKSRLASGDGHDLDLSAYERHFPDFSQGSIESDQNLTARSTRFGNGKARVQSRTSRETPSVLSTPTPRLASDVARKHDPLLPRFVKGSSLSKTEPQLPRPSQKIPTTRHATSRPLVQHQADMPVYLPGKSEAQSTTTLPLPEVPNLTELVAGVYDDGTPVFSDNKKCYASRFASASQAGENTNQVSLPDVDKLTPKYDEKKLLASIRSLENKVAELEHHQAESEHTIHYLRQKAFEAESKGRSAGRRSDSALGSISGGSDAGEDKSDGEYRKLMIEKNRIVSRNDALNEIALAYQDNLKTVTQERDSAVSQLGAAYVTNEQLKLENKALLAEIDELRGNIDDLIAHQEESSIGFEADPDMTAKDAECDRIMYQREQADSTRQRIKASLRARREQVTEPIPDLPPRIFPVSDDKRESQPATTHQEPKVTIDDVSLDLSYQSNIPGTTTDVRQDLEGHKVDDQPSQISVREDESALSCSQRSTPDRWAIRSIGTPEDHGTLIIDGERVYLGRLHKQKDAGEQFAKVKPVRKVTPYPMIRTDLQSPKPEASVMSTRSYRDDRSDMTSAWIVPDITIDFPEPKEPSIPQVSEIKGEISGGEHSDSSQSTVERVLRQSRITQSSLLDDNSKTTAERAVNQFPEAQRSLLDDDPKATEHSSGQNRATQRSLLEDHFDSTIERNFGQNRAIRRSLIDGSELTIGQTRAIQRSLLDDGSEPSIGQARATHRSLLDDESERSIGQAPATHRSLPSYDIQSTAERNVGQTRTTHRSLLDDDAQSAVGRSFIAPQIDDNKSIATHNICQNQPALPSLLDFDSKPVVIASDAQPKTKRTKVVRRPIPVSDRMPVPGPYEEEPTIRPSQHPGIALATVLAALEGELSELKRSAKKYQQLYDDHDAALSKRSRKNVFEKLQKLNQTIDAKADQIYSLYDVLEGQKQCGQEMSQEEVEVTLQSIGIDPEEIPWDGMESTGTHSTSSSRRA